LGLNYFGFTQSANTVRWDNILREFTSTFDVEPLIIRAHNTMVPDYWHGVSGQARRAFSQCVEAIINLIRQVITVQGNKYTILNPLLYDQLFALLTCLPIIVLRGTDNTTPNHFAKSQKTRCGRFLRGDWARLYDEAIKEAEAYNQQAERRCQSLAAPDSIKHNLKYEVAKQLVEKGNISRARQFLTSPGITDLPMNQAWCRR
jgi:hypothetical protein